MATIHQTNRDFNFDASDLRAIAQRSGSSQFDSAISFLQECLNSHVQQWNEFQSAGSRGLATNYNTWILYNGYLGLKNGQAHLLRAIATLPLDVQQSTQLSMSRMEEHMRSFEQTAFRR